MTWAALRGEVHEGLCVYQSSGLACLSSAVDRKRQELNRANDQSRQRQVDAAKARHEEAMRLVDALVTSRRSHVILNRNF